MVISHQANASQIHEFITSHLLERAIIKKVMFVRMYRNKKHLRLVSGNVNRKATIENIRRFFKKLNIIPLGEFIQRKLHHCHNKIFAPPRSLQIFTIVETWKQPECPLTVN